MKPKKQKMNNTAFMLFKKGENKMKFLVLKKASGLEIDPMKKVCYKCLELSGTHGCRERNCRLRNRIPSLIE